MSAGWLHTTAVPWMFATIDESLGHLRRFSLRLRVSVVKTGPTMKKLS
jgi:hypothetical protein